MPPSELITKQAKQDNKTNICFVIPLQVACINYCNTAPSWDEFLYLLNFDSFNEKWKTCFR
jgi:hypothetical protein